MDFQQVLRYKIQAMFAFLGRLFAGSPPHRRPSSTDTLAEERWTAQFGKTRGARFKAETTANVIVDIDKSGLTLRLKQGARQAWTVNPVNRYADATIDAVINQPTDGRYQAAGILFRYGDDGSYYAALVSTKGYLRLDAVFNGSPINLIAWTEIAPSSEPGMTRLKIIVSGDRFVFIVNEVWVGEISDGTLAVGRTGFVVADYQGSGQAVARLGRYRIDSRPLDVETTYYRWNKYLKIDPSARINLASSFMAIGQFLPALTQIKKAWKDMESLGGERSQTSLIMAAECALRLALLPEAEDYLDRCIEADSESPQAEQALTTKARLLYDANRFLELRDHTESAGYWFPKNATFQTLLAHACWNLGLWKEAAAAYRIASGLNPDSGIIAQNLAQADERLGDIEASVAGYLRAGTAFLNSEAYDDLNLIVMKLRELSPTDRKVTALSGKLAFALGNYLEAEEEFRRADVAGVSAATQSETAVDGLVSINPTELSNHTDPAVPFLRGLIRLKTGHWSAALPFFDRAVRLDGKFAPFRFRAAETRFLLKPSTETSQFREDLAAALALAPEDAWILNLAAQKAIVAGDLTAAASYADKAFGILPEESAIIANLAELRFLEGRVDEALNLLSWPSGNDNESKVNNTAIDGFLANEAGNILVRLGRYEEADQAYAAAVKADSKRPNYWQNKAACLVELGRYGEADDNLVKAFELEPSNRTLELIAYVAAKKGEFARAEAAYRVGLENEPADPALLKGLAWLYLLMARWDSAEDIISRLERGVLRRGADATSESQAGARRKDDDDSIADLRQRLTEAVTRKVACSACGREWRVAKNPSPIGPLRLIAEPPDDYPAGSCVKCGRYFCIACGKKALKNDRFHCPECGGGLMLNDEGIKKLLADWASLKQPPP